MSRNLLDRLQRLLGLGAALPSWREVVEADAGRIGEARLAMDQEGRGMALWENGGQLWSTHPGAGALGTRVLLADGRTPRVVMNGRGRGSALWTARQGEWEMVLGRPLGQGEALTRRLFSTGGQVRHLQAAVDRRGSVLAVWSEEAAGRTSVLTQAFDPRSVAWEGLPTPLGVLPEGAGEPILALNPSGQGMVLLPVTGDGFEGLACHHYLPSRRDWSERPVPVCPGRVLQHRAMLDGEGNAQVVMVVQGPDDRESLLACGYDAARGCWGELRRLAAGKALRGLRLAPAGDGSALAAWSQTESAGAPRLLGRWFRRGAWDGTGRPLDPGGGLASAWAVAATEEGRGSLLTVQREGGGHRVVVRDIGPDAPPPTALGSVQPQPALRPRLALGPRGGAALWVQPGPGGATLNLALAH